MSSNVDFTPRELEILAKAWGCMDSAPVVNFNKLAAACGMGNPKSASNAWTKIRQKIEAKAAADGSPPQASDRAANTPKSATKRRAKKEVDGETPSKKAKGKGAAKKEDDDGEEIDVKQEHEGDGEDDADVFT